VEFAPIAGELDDRGEPSSGMARLDDEEPISLMPGADAKNMTLSATMARMTGVIPIRYQVFLSSTFTDLQLERQAVSRALSFMEQCIPAGMERFPASSAQAWDVIRPILDLTDYLVLLIGHRYGSITEDGLGYTEREYDYAYGLDIPVIPFIRDDEPESVPETHRDTDAAAIAKLVQFKSKVLSRHTVQSCDSPGDLGVRVVASLIHEFDSSPRPGWVRGRRPDIPASPGPAPLPVATPPQPTEPRRPEQALRVAVDDMRASPALAADARVDGMPDYIRSEHALRLATIEESIVPILSATAQIISGTDRSLDREWQELIPRLAPNPRLSGSTDLINLRRAPGVLLYHFAGCGSAAENRDEIIGRLLSRRLVVEDPFLGDVPAAASLVPGVVYPAQLATRRMYDFLIQVMVDVCELGRERSFDAWERWMYLYCVECQYLQANGVSVYPGYPHLVVEEAGQRQMRVVAGKSVLREFEERGNQHPILQAGMCEGSYELFVAAAETFESNYTHWADQQDWAQLPPGGGWMPTGPHYPGARSE